MLSVPYDLYQKKSQQTEHHDSDNPVDHVTPPIRKMSEPI